MIYALIQDNRVKNVFEWKEKNIPEVGEKYVLVLTDLNARVGDVYDSKSNKISVPDKNTIEADEIKQAKILKIQSLTEKYNVYLDLGNMKLETNKIEINSLATKEEVDNFNIDVFQSDKI